MDGTDCWLPLPYFECCMGLYESSVWIRMRRPKVQYEVTTPAVHLMEVRRGPSSCSFHAFISPPQVGAIPPKERVELFRHLQQSNRAALLSFLEENFLAEEEGEGAASIHPAVYEVRAMNAWTSSTSCVSDCSQ